MIDNKKQSIPKDWRQAKLGDVADITNGKTNSQDAISGGIYPLFDRSIAIKQSDKFLFDATAVILPGEGAEFVPRYFSGKFDLHQRAYVILPKENIDPRYLYYFLFDRRNVFAQNAVGSTVKSLRLPIIQAVPVNVPPFVEQKKIAEILGTVDAEIQKTDEIIVTTEKLKKGLMQELFTKGVGHTKFKKTKIGKVPEEWSVVSLQTMIDEGLITGHLDGNHGELYPKSSEFINEGVPYLSANCLEDGEVNFSKAKFLSPNRASKFLKGVAVNGDVIFAHNATVGPVALLATKEKYVILSTTLTYYRCDENKLIPAYLRYFMESSQFSDQYKRVMAQTTRNQVPITMQRTFLHAIPVLAEQKKIAEFLSIIDEKILINKKIKEKLTLLKKGLMQDLLSGRVRVNI